MIASNGTPFLKDTEDQKFSALDWGWLDLRSNSLVLCPSRGQKANSELTSEDRRGRFRHWIWRIEWPHCFKKPIRDASQSYSQYLIYIPLQWNSPCAHSIIHPQTTNSKHDYFRKWTFTFRLHSYQPKVDVASFFWWSSAHDIQEARHSSPFGTTFFIPIIFFFLESNFKRNLRACLNIHLIHVSVITAEHIHVRSYNLSHEQSSSLKDQASNKD